MGRFSASSVAKKIKRTFSSTSLNRFVTPQEEAQEATSPATELEYSSTRPQSRRCWTAHPKHHGKFRENLPDAYDADDEHANSMTSVPREEFQARRANTEPVMSTYSAQKKKPWWTMTDEELRQEYEQCRAKAPDVGPNFLWCNRRDSLDEDAILASMGLKRAQTFSAYSTCCSKIGKTVEKNEKVAVPIHANESEALAQGDIVDLTTPPMAALLSKALPPESPELKFTLPSPPHWFLKPRPAPFSLIKYRSALREKVKEVNPRMNDDASVSDKSDYSDIFRPLEKNMWI